MEYRKTQVETATVGDGKIWFISGDIQALYSCDIETDEVSFVVEIGTYTDKKPYLYYSLYYFAKKIFMIPWLNKNMRIFDTQKKVLETIEFPQKYADCMFCGAYYIDGYLFASSPYKPIIMRFNLNDYHLDFLEITEISNRSNKLYFGGLPMIEGNRLFFVCRCENLIIEIRTDIFEYKIHVILDVVSNDGYFSIAKYKEFFVCTPEKSRDSIWLLDKEFHVVKKICTGCKGRKPICGYNFNDSFFLFSLDDELTNNDYKVRRYHPVISLFEGGIIAFNESRDSVMILCDNGREYIKEMRIPMDENLKRIVMKNNIVTEGYFGLKDYIKGL